MLHIEVRVKISFKQEKIREVNSKKEKKEIIYYEELYATPPPPPTHAQKVTCSPPLLNGFTRYKRNYFYTKCKVEDANFFEQLTHIIHSICLILPGIIHMS